MGVIEKLYSTVTAFKAVAPAISDGLLQLKVMGTLNKHKDKKDKKKTHREERLP